MFTLFSDDYYEKCDLRNSLSVPSNSSKLQQSSFLSTLNRTRLSVISEEDSEEENTLYEKFFKSTSKEIKNSIFNVCEIYEEK